MYNNYIITILYTMLSAERERFKKGNAEQYELQERKWKKAIMRVVALTTAGAMMIIGTKAYTDEDFGNTLGQIDEKAEKVVKIIKDVIYTDMNKRF